MIHAHHQTESYLYYFIFKYPESLIDVYLDCKTCDNLVISLKSSCRHLSCNSTWHFLLPRSALSSPGVGLKSLSTVIQLALIRIYLDDSVHLNVSGQ